MWKSQSAHPVVFATPADEQVTVATSTESSEVLDKCGLHKADGTDSSLFESRQIVTKIKIQKKWKSFISIFLLVP